MKKSLFSIVFLVFFISLNSYSQSLKEKLNQLQKTYDFSFKEMKTNDDFKEKYLINFKQKLDYQGKTNDTFTQRVFISHKDFNKPVVFITEGYDANRAESPDFESEITKYLESNQVCIEHRYFGQSKPDSLVWEYLTVENAANDHHRIAMFVKNIYCGKIISTGISKGGQTTNFFKYFFPEDADICVPYVAPLNFSPEDKRVYTFLENVGSSECRDKILTYQRNMLENKDRYLGSFKTMAEKKDLQYSMGIEKAYELLVFEYSFAFWQWGMYDCNDIPTDIDDANKMLNHLDKVAGFDWISVEGIKKMQPFFYQAMREIGMYGYDIKNFKGLTSYTNNPIFDFTFPQGIKVVYEPELMQRVDFFLRHKAENMIFIYGETDPWSAPSVELGSHTNSIKVVKENGSHRTRIKNLPAQQRNQILDSLKTWLAKPKKFTEMDNKDYKKVTGVGGVFFKSEDPAKLREWYKTNLGLVTNEYGSLFEFRSSDEPDNKAYLQWSPFPEKTKYFEPSEKQFMINYRVENIERLVEDLKKNGVTILDEIETYEYGKFVHILDSENNKIELWEPIDSVFTKLYDGQTTK